MRSLLALAVASICVLAACQCGPDGINVGTGGGSGSPGGGAGSVGGGSGSTGGGSGSTGGGSGSTGGGQGGGACATVTSQAKLGKKPVDIIMVIDNSGSMTEEIVGVQENINSNFAAIVNDAGIDYRVILLSTHGRADAGQSICITQPLSGNPTCEPPPAKPVNTTRFFHYSTEISSTNSLSKITQTYKQPDPNGAAPGGWSEWLRADAAKTFIEITDDNSSQNAANFENALFALTPAQFGTATNRNYVFHAITGIQAKANPGDAYLPSEPLNNQKCPLGVNPGGVYQELARTTGGLRFPICDPTKFDTVFKTVAQGVVQTATLACEFAIPTPPPGFTLSNKIYVEYTPTGGTLQQFSVVANTGMCGAKNFTAANSKVTLCPQACTAVKADPTGKIEVRFTCESGGIN